ncbi:MarR family winged helix-turn-helix transcriptional regulator [Candidatus Nucleicultrix amoebiphila]|jgi:DNA-binding MarR family transcriptional regulator|uniref:MarR family transcriptional regulator n=1 Tax=Candidatus Nucleicultrix amoebiphila FS5 TaxID=1414854 RepID=A0A1W6N6B3_9PROT|nr:MarR family winged helix-turn-helix transcriptional regulator [Candidatus Nucleicultrix amoebiphila]ARN85417.1 MarR family transcriptional regulator [Candidatus Nucleicultrix amoebiphila FS5]
MKQVYFDTIMLIERLHRQFLEVVRVELDRINVTDITNIQCFILYNIGKTRLSVGEVSNRGYYLGSNVTYNLKKMVENGYLVQEQSPHDRRSSYISLSKKGETLYDRIETIFTEHAKNLKHNGISDEDIKHMKSLLQKLEGFWTFTATHEVRF